MTVRSTFKKGDVLFREAQPSLSVLRIQRGEVEVVREVDGKTVVLGHVREGEWLGEMAAVERRNHSATARATVDGSAEVLSVQQFLDQVSRDSALAQELIFRLSIRLRNVEDRIAGTAPQVAQPEERAEAPAGALAISLTAQSESLRALIGSAPINVKRLPFVVGREPMTGERRPARAPDLRIKDDAPFRLSRDHFMVERVESGALVVSDLDSTLGTIVNGKPIGSHFNQDSARLHEGRNRVQAGGLDSPFDFVISVG